MVRKFIDFADIERLATIDQLAEMLGLEVVKSQTQLRCACPIHGGDARTLAISPQVRSKRGSMGVFFCQKSQSGGDRIGLVAHCMDIGQQDAAFFIQEQFGNGTDTSESTVKGTVTVSKERANSSPSPFNPEKFWANCFFNEEVAALGISEEDAARVLIGYHTKYKAVFIGSRNEDGSKAGFTKVLDPRGLKFPPQWVRSAQVVQLRRA